jgi:hypothetical protein
MYTLAPAGADPMDIDPKIAGISVGLIVCELPAVTY